MCHPIRDADFERQRGQQALPPSEMNSLRPRRLAGAVVAVVAVVAAAVALLFPASTPALSTSPSAAFVGPPVEQTSSGLDDGVPASTSHAGGADCSREL